MKKFFRVWLDEYKLIFKDFGVLLIFFGAIVIYPFFYPLPYSAEVLKNVPVAVVDTNKTRLSARMTRMIDANELVSVKPIPDFKEARTQLLKGEAGGIILIPGDFEKKILKGEQASVSVYSDASYFLIYKQVLTGIYNSVGTFSAGIEIKRMMAGGFTSAQAASARDPLPLISIPLFNASGGYATYLIPAAFILILQQTLLIGIGLLAGTAAEKKERKTRSSADPGILSMVLGRSCAYFSIYMVHAVYLLGILFRFYHFPQKGDPFDLILFLIPFLFACIFLAQSISGFFKTRETSLVILIFSAIPMLFLSGITWPKSSMPVWMNHLAGFLPSTSGIDGVLRISQMGASLKDVCSDFAILLILTLVYFVMAVISTGSRTKNPL